MSTPPSKKQVRQQQKARKDRLKQVCYSISQSSTIEAHDLDVVLLRSASANAHPLPSPPSTTASELVVHFSTHLSSAERRFVHSIASSFNLYHWSTGFGKQRHVCISLTQIPPVSLDLDQAEELTIKPQQQFKVFIPDTASYKDDIKFSLPHPHLSTINDLLANVPTQANILRQSTIQSKSKPPTSSNTISQTPLIFVNDVKTLAKTAKHLSLLKYIAVDLEMNNNRSYNGLTCLIQISTSDSDFIIDCLLLWDNIHNYLADIFADKNICKVFHACSGGDIPALDRDFNIQVCNIFDTQNAAKVLGLAQLSLEYMLIEYLQVQDLDHVQIQELKATYTCSDWRRRPLHEMQLLYARMDTHYLLELRSRLVQELCGVSIENSKTQQDMDATLIAAAAFGRGEVANEAHIIVALLDSEEDSSDEDSDDDRGSVCTKVSANLPPLPPLLGSVDVEEDALCHSLHLSHKCSLSRFCAKKRPDQLIKKDKSWRSMRKFWKRKKEHRDILYQNLFAWRDTLARSNDESAHYCCPSDVLVKITNALPLSTQALIRLWNPLPPLLQDANIQASLFHVLTEWSDAIATSTPTSQGLPVIHAATKL
jgi:ribonuclease D